MKLILESWRQYLKEQQAKESLGVMVDFNEGYEISLSLVDLNKIKTKSPLLNSIFHTFGFLKFPTPAFEISNGNISFHPIYY